MRLSIFILMALFFILTCSGSNLQAIEDPDSPEYIDLK